MKKLSEKLPDSVIRRDILIDEAPSAILLLQGKPLPSNPFPFSAGMFGLCPI